ncbi:rhodanese-like domain-containing protein [Nocardioides aurantiacus]|uniref:rhodanese-like domain-containing protein n=1 Tax=Nocardioides aurantiacus TaxID=86796 RepID=UPI00403FB6D8
MNASVPRRRARPVPAVLSAMAVAAVIALLAWALAGCDTSRDAASPSGSPTSTGLPDQAATRVVDVQSTRRALADGAAAIDVRTAEEYAAGHLTGARNISLADPDFDRRLSALDPDEDYVVYCASGRRAAEAITRMKESGFTGRLLNAGGFTDLRAAGLEVDAG